MVVARVASRDGRRMTHAATPATHRRIGGFDVLDTSSTALIERLDARAAEGLRTILLFANANFVLRCHPFRDALRDLDALIVNDGIGLDLAARLFHRRAFTENLNGTDFTPKLLRSRQARTRLFLLGARPATVRAAAHLWSQWRHLEIVGALDGYDGMADDAQVVDNIGRSSPDILLVALGNPRQERWIVEHHDRLDVPLTIGVGALFDFASGHVRRAPRLVRALRCEWLYRLAREPHRLMKRYSVDLVLFFVHCMRTHRTDRLAAKIAEAP